MTVNAMDDIYRILIYYFISIFSRRYADDSEFVPGSCRKAIFLVKLRYKCFDCSQWPFCVSNGIDLIDSIIIR